MEWEREWGGAGSGSLRRGEEAAVTAVLIHASSPRTSLSWAISVGRPSGVQARDPPRGVRAGAAAWPLGWVKRTVAHAPKALVAGAAFMGWQQWWVA